MRTKTQKQNMLMRIIKAPVRMMSKARNLYVKSLTNCGAMPGAVATRQRCSPLPRSFSAQPSRSSGDDEDYSELIRAASVRRFGHSNEVDMYLQQVREQTSSPVKTQSKNKVLPKSCSVGMGFMGKIDEDGPSDFDQEVVVGGGGDGDDNGKTETYTRSRSCAVGETRARGNGSMTGRGDQRSLHF